jgi:uncharacterized protein YgiM (DUF1202 family)
MISKEIEMRKKFAFVFLILTMLACNLSNPSSEVVPTLEPTTVIFVVVEPTLTPTIAVTDTPEPTATPTLPPEVTLLKDSNCRLGPNEYYFYVDQIAKDTVLPVVGRTSDSSWWQVINPTDRECWVFSENSQANQDLSAVPIVEGPALPNPPINFFVAGKDCKPGAGTFSVSFKWESGGGDGFRLYRNGAQIIEMAPDKTKFTDKNAPLNQNLSYELFAFNKYGISTPAVQILQACT